MALFIIGIIAFVFAVLGFIAVFAAWLITRRFKRLVLIMGTIFLLSTGLFVTGVITFVNSAGPAGGVASITSGSFSGWRDSLNDGIWRITVRRANGFMRRTPNLDEGRLAGFHVNSQNTEGVVYLELYHRDSGTRHIVDISGYFNETINLVAEGFPPGRVQVRVNFTQAYDVHTIIDWGGAR